MKKKGNIKLVIFDFDGCIANTSPVAAKVVKEIAHKYVKSNQNLRKIFYEKGMKGLIKEVHCPKWKVPIIVRDFRKTMKKYANQIKVNPGLKILLKELNKNYTLAIISSNSKENINLFLEKNNIEDYFDSVRTNVSLFTKAWRIKRLIRKFDVNKEESVYVGDEVRDIKAAQKAGIKSIAVAWGMNSPQLLKKQHPSFIANKPKDILNWLKK